MEYPRVVDLFYPGAFNGWMDTGCTFPSGWLLDVRAFGVVDMEDGSGVAWVQPEGRYSSNLPVEPYRPEEVMGWAELGVPPEGRITADVPPGGLTLWIGADGVEPPEIDFVGPMAPVSALYPRRYRRFDAAEVAAFAGEHPWYRAWITCNDIDTGLTNGGAWRVVLSPIDGLALGSHDQRHWVFKYDESESLEDRLAGGFCEETGFWAPGHRLAEDTAGRRVIDDFAARLDPAKGEGLWHRR